MVNITRKKFVIIICAVALIAILCFSLGYVIASSSLSSTYIEGGISPGAPSYTVWVESGTYYAKDAHGHIAYSETELGVILSDCVASNIAIQLAPGTFSYSTTVTITQSNLKITGMGMDTVIVPSANLPLFKLQNPSANVEICNLAFNDTGSTLTSAGFIYLNNNNGIICYPNIHNIYFENGYQNIYTDNIGTHYWLLGLKLNQLQFVNPRGSAIYLNYTVQENVNGITILVGVNVASPLIYRITYMYTPLGGFWDNVAIHRTVNSATMNGMILIQWTVDLTMNNVILDGNNTGSGGSTGYLLEADHVTKGKFNNWYVYHSSTDGIHLETGCAYNLFNELTIMYNGGYGVNDVRSDTAPNAFQIFYEADNTAGNYNLTSYDLWNATFASYP